MTFSPELAGRTCIEKARRLLDLAAHPPPVAETQEDLCRHALVSGITAIDSYMHWLVFTRLSDVRWRETLPKRLQNLDIPFSDLASLADSALGAQQDGRRIRPWVQVKNALQNRILSMTFQSYSQVAGAFSLAGIEKSWSKIAAEIGEPASQIESRLNGLVHRRNQIVHEGDIMRMSRPRAIRHNPVDHAEVSAEIDWVERLLAAMQTVVARES